jgi:hypothetical protein
MEAEWTVWDEWTAARGNEGYRLWLYAPPPASTWIEAVRYEWPGRQVWCAGSEAPEFNVAGLWWRPWTGETIEGAVADAPHETQAHGLRRIALSR